MVYSYGEIIKEYIIMKKQNESKRDCFVRIAEARTNKIIDMLRLLGNCSNTTKTKFDTVTTNNSKFKL